MDPHARNVGVAFGALLGTTASAGTIEMKVYGLVCAFCA